MCCAVLSCPALCDSVDCSQPGSSVHRDSPGKNTGVSCHALLQGIFPTQESNWGLRSLACIAGSSLPAELPGKSQVLSSPPSLPKQDRADPEGSSYPTAHISVFTFLGTLPCHPSALPSTFYTLSLSPSYFLPSWTRLELQTLLESDPLWGP